MPQYKYVIVGGGMTADAAIGGIRQADPSGSIGLIGCGYRSDYQREILAYRCPPTRGVRHERERTMVMMKVADVSDVSVGTGKVVQAEGKALALFNLGGTFYALDNRCTHVGGPLGEGAVEGNRVTCPWHGSVFNITTGEVVEPPARRPVATFRVQVEGDEVLVELP